MGSLRDIVSKHLLDSHQLFTEPNGPEPTGRQCINYVDPFERLFLLLAFFLEVVYVLLHDQDREVPVEYLDGVVEYLVLDQLVLLIAIQVLRMDACLSLLDQLEVTLPHDVGITSRLCLGFRLHGDRFATKIIFDRQPTHEYHYSFIVEFDTDENYSAYCYGS